MSKAATELEKMISEGKVVLIEASKLSLDDRFMKYQPKDDKEKAFKKLLTEAIKNGLKDFYRPVLDPSFNDDKSGICYEFGRRPADGKSYKWWINAAKEFMPNSRLGTRDEYAAFLGVIIKKRVESGWNISKSWKDVCVDSKELGHYRNSEDAKRTYEDTGLREICGFYDLANTFKILAEDKKIAGFYQAGGDYYSLSSYDPLANFHVEYRRNNNLYGVGWLVIDCEN